MCMIHGVCVWDWIGLGVTSFGCIRTDSGGSNGGRIGNSRALAGYPTCTLDNIALVMIKLR